MESESFKVAYKVVRKDEEGNYISFLAGRKGFAPEDKPVLKYVEGEITEASPMGVFIKETLEDAKKLADAYKGLDVRAFVLEVIPIGEVSYWGSEPHCPKVLVGKEVWREEEFRPEPKFKVGQVLTYCPNGKYPGTLVHVTEIRWEESHGHYHYKVVEYSGSLDEDELEPAPEWVDITKDCLFKLLDYVGDNTFKVLTIEHEGSNIGYIGADGVDVRWTNYRAIADYPWNTCGSYSKDRENRWFRIEKKTS